MEQSDEEISRYFDILDGSAGDGIVNESQNRNRSKRMDQ
jgi:hypothetical protein